MREAVGLFGVLLRVITTLNHIGAAALTFMMFLTVSDVLLRAFGHPIMGTYEIVSQSLAVEWNAIDIEGREFFKSNGGQILPLSDAEADRWVKASEPVVAGFKKDLTAKGYTEKEVDSWLAFIKERVEHWKAQEKAKKIPTAYEY